MSRWWPALLLAVALFAQKEQNPPEEDTASSGEPKSYTFNPLQAEKELRVGNFYFKKGSYRAASLRFQEATRWHSGFAEAYRRLGDSEEKQKNFKTAHAAYSKYIELEPNGKYAAEVRKRLAQKLTQ